MDFATQQIFKCTLFISFCYWQTLCKSPFEIAVRSGKHWCQLGLNFSDLKGRTDSSDSWGEWAGTPSCKECWRRAPCCWGRRDSAATDGGKRCNNMAHVLKTTPLKKKKKMQGAVPPSLFLPVYAVWPSAPARPQLSDVTASNNSVSHRAAVT